MNIKLFVVGKTNESYLQVGIDEYLKRLTRYANFSMEVIPDVKNAKSLTPAQLKTAESTLLMNKIDCSDHLILLDENGAEYSSEGFARFIEQMGLRSVKTLVFVVGGAFGFDDVMYKRANGKLSLSKMTFSHQMIRLLFVEQLYRAHTIIKGEPYHHK